MSDALLCVTLLYLPTTNWYKKIKKIQLWASFANFKQKTILEAEASIVPNNYIVNLRIIQTLNN